MNCEEYAYNLVARAKGNVERLERISNAVSRRRLWAVHYGPLTQLSQWMRIDTIVHLELGRLKYDMGRNFNFFYYDSSENGIVKKLKCGFHMELTR